MRPTGRSRRAGSLEALGVRVQDRRGVGLAPGLGEGNQACRCARQYRVVMETTGRGRSGAQFAMTGGAAYTGEGA